MNPVQQRLLDTACELFYEEGIAHVGVDRLVRDANVAKMTLYHCFGSKDGLVVAFLEESDRRWRQWFTERLDHRHPESASTVARFFAVLQDWLRVNAHRGCPLINAAVELADATHPGMDVVREHREYLRRLFAELIAADGITPTAALIEQMLILMDGAIIGSLMGQAEAPTAAGDAAVAILRTHATARGDGQ